MLLAFSKTACAACLDGQTFWPCDVDGLCFCWDPSTPRVPPAPSSGKAQLSDERPCDFFTEAMYNELGPDHEFPYTYEGLCLAIDHYNEGHAEKIFMMGTEDEKKKELAAFLGHTLHESDEWKAGREYLICAGEFAKYEVSFYRRHCNQSVTHLTCHVLSLNQDNKMVGDETYCKPCTADEFDWETFKCTGVGMAGGGVTFNGYCDYVIEPPLACPCDGALMGDADGYIPASDVFFGRGAVSHRNGYDFVPSSHLTQSSYSRHVWFLSDSTFMELQLSCSIRSFDLRSQYILRKPRSGSNHTRICMGCRDFLLDGELERGDDMPH